MNIFPCKAATFSLLIGLIGLLQACGSDGNVAQDVTPIQVKTRVLEVRSLPISLSYSGRTEGSKDVEVRARVEGILLHRKYHEGEAVEAGQLLFEIDDAPFQVALDRSNAQLARAKAGLAAAQRRWSRASELIKRDAISQRERDDALSELELAQAELKLAEAEVNAAKINLDYTRVRAPIAGITSREQVSEGSLVGPQSSLLTRITQLDPIWVNISIPDSELLNFRRMLESGELRFVSNQRAVEIETATGQKHPYEGQINFTESAVDRQTGTVRMRATVANPEGTLLPGQFVRVALEGMQSVDTLTVPARAVMQSAQGSYVYRVNDKGQAETVMIKLGLTTSEGTVVETGLDAGDRIIVEGLGRVRSGEAVSFDANSRSESETAGKNPSASAAGDEVSAPASGQSAAGNEP